MVSAVFRLLPNKDSFVHLCCPCRGHYRMTANLSPTCRVWFHGAGCFLCCGSILRQFMVYKIVYSLSHTKDAV